MRVTLDIRSLPQLDLRISAPGIEAALNRIAAALEPEKQAKATAVTFTTEPEPIGSLPEERPMDQYHVGIDGFKTRMRFNGLIDGEPTVTSTGPGTMTQDAKIVQPAQDNPAQSETLVDLHFRNAGPAVGIVNITVHAIADDPVTPEEEDIDATADVAEWIAQTQAKATTVSFSTTPEPI